MNHLKTLSVPVVSALLATSILPASAQITMDATSDKTYRTLKEGTKFMGGFFDVNVSDGDGIYVKGCSSSYYYSPADKWLSFCSGGTTAYLLTGTIDDSILNESLKYFWVTNVIPAVIIEPRRPDLCALVAAPASKLARPSKGFSDQSFSIYYNLHTTEVQEYIISRYANSRDYGVGESERQRFSSEIVPGVYHYSFPRLNYPNLKAALSTVIYPMAEARQTINNQDVGFTFTFDDERHWTKSGFVELSVHKPNTISWKGLTASNVLTQVDNLFFSMRVMSNPNNPNSALDLYTYDALTGEQLPQSVFPAFVNGGDARIKLKTPLSQSITIPPIFPPGTRAMVSVDLDRDLKTSGIGFDHSRRRFQIPVIVVDRYSEYAEIAFNNAGGNRDILADFDRDGSNNLTEWILDSRAEDPTSRPIPPYATNHEAVYTDVAYFDLFYYFYSEHLLVRNQYYGFTIDEKLTTVPDVRYTVQRSRDSGKTWQVMTSDSNWNVYRAKIPAGANGVDSAPAQAQIRVESKIYKTIDPKTGAPLYIQPPGTQNDIYRVKVSLVK